MNTLRRAWQGPFSSGSHPARRPGRPWALGARPASLWLALMAILCVLAMLLAFRQVVAQGVEQARSRHLETAAHTDAVWRCNALRSASQRAGCRVQLQARQAVAATTVAKVTR